MTVRIVMFHPDGRALCGMDGNHGEGHAAAWVSDVAAQIEREFGVVPVVVEFDPVAGGDDAKETIRSLHELRLDLHARPDGTLEPVTIARKALPVCQAMRVLHAPAHVAGKRHTMRNRGRALGELAHEWRMASDSTYRRNHERARRARGG